MNANEFIEVRWTSGSIDEARRVSRYLVQERLVACAQIIPWIESIYMWDNQLETTQETKVVFKAKHINYDKIKSVILENCKYEIPEITYVYIAGGNETYLEWVNESTLEMTSQ